MVWDPTHVQLLVIRAKGLLTKGKNGTNDAFVVMSMGKEKFQTSIKDRSGPDVEWGEECELAIPNQGNTAEICVTVYHRSMLGIDEFLGTVSIPLKNFDVYERPKAKWYPLEFKNDKKQGYRGEVELMVSFTVKSGSLTDLSKKEKHKGSLGQLSVKAHNLGGAIGGSLMNLGTSSKGGIKKFTSSVGHKIAKLPGRNSMRGDKRAESGYFERRGSGRSMQSSSIGDPDQGTISEDEDEFKLDQLSQRSSSSSLNTAGQGFTPAQGSLENLAGGEFLSRSFSGPRSGTLPANLNLAGKPPSVEPVPNKPPRLGMVASPDEWEKKLFGRNAKATERPIDDTPVESSVPSIVVQQQPVTSPTEEADPDAFQFTRRNASRRGRKKPEEPAEKEVRSAVVAPMPRNPEPEKVEPTNPVKGMNQFEPRHEHVVGNPFDVDKLGVVDDDLKSEWDIQQPLDLEPLAKAHAIPQEIDTIKEEDEAVVEADLQNKQTRNARSDGNRNDHLVSEEIAVYDIEPILIKSEEITHEVSVNPKVLSAPITSAAADSSVDKESKFGIEVKTEPSLFETEESSQLSADSFLDRRSNVSLISLPLPTISEIPVPVARKTLPFSVKKEPEEPESFPIIVEHSDEYSLNNKSSIKTENTSVIHLKDSVAPSNEVSKQPSPAMRKRATDIVNELEGPVVEKVSEVRKVPSPAVRKREMNEDEHDKRIVTMSTSDDLSKPGAAATDRAQSAIRQIDLDDLPDSAVDDSGYQDQSRPSSVDFSPERNVDPVPASAFFTPVATSLATPGATPAAVTDFFSPVSHFSVVDPHVNHEESGGDDSVNSLESGMAVADGFALPVVVDLTQDDEDFVDMPVVGLSPRPSDSSFQFGAPDTAISEEQSFSEESAVDVPTRDAKAIIRVHESHRRTLEGIQGLSDFEPTDSPEIFRLAANRVPEKKLLVAPSDSFLNSSTVTESSFQNEALQEVESPESNGRPELSSRIIEGGESPVKPSVKLPPSVREELANKTKEELIVLIHNLRQVMRDKDEYISAILLRCMEQCPKVLESPLLKK